MRISIIQKFQEKNPHLLVLLGLLESLRLLVLERRFPLLLGDRLRDLVDPLDLERVLERERDLDLVLERERRDEYLYLKI